ncbi:hypothetical protein SAMN05216338_10192 [Bradyrhizobium sp. Rc2d]|uniref:hypothetical protein n=1 Tax=Bradyrhizobium sp. Rc2d TaxID=1855321 RepID=UPI00088FA9B0|nr:hypothetical protein [Bradyrhizobium sp. Rc2d]SDI22961.1 hypothetical protein SAMN05216338_10192 [Bradyrhizobium sp. Rc2d]
MRYYGNKELEQGHRGTLDEHTHSLKKVGEQIARSRAQIFKSQKILHQPVPKLGRAEVPQIPTAAECRILAEIFKRRATETKLSERTATIMKNVSRSLSGLAHQLEMLSDTDRQEY